VSDETYFVLERLEKKFKGKSFDKVIENLISNELDIPEDMYGIDRDRMEDREG